MNGMGWCPMTKYGQKTNIVGWYPHIWIVVCEGVKQICRIWGNKKIFFCPTGAEMTFTPSQLGQDPARIVSQTVDLCIFYGQKMAFVKLSELINFIDMLLLGFFLAVCEGRGVRDVHL